MATRKQIDYARDLADDLGRELSEVVEEVTGNADIEDCDVEEASEVIDYLLEELYALREEQRLWGD